MLKRILPIVLVIIVLAACSALSETEDAAVEEIEVVAQVATDVPVIEATSEPVVVEATTLPVIIQPTSEPIVQATEIPTLEPTAIPEIGAYNAPEWVNLSLINARTGETFTLASFAGKTIFVEPMATWCSNCRAQQGLVSQAMANLNSDDFVFISLSVGENVSDEILAAYAERNGFPQIFAVASTDITNALVQTFGFSITSPPSTPHFTISPIGTISGLATGFHQTDAIIQEVMTAQNS